MIALTLCNHGRAIFRFRKSRETQFLNKYLIYPQDNGLLNDIRSFYSHRNKIFKRYEKIGYEYGNDYMDEFNIYSIIDNDLMAFWNDDVAYTLGVTDKNYIKMFRQLAFNIKNDKDSIMANYNFHLKNQNFCHYKID